MPHRVLGLDAYTLRARIAPALLVVLPAGLALAAWFPIEAQLQGALVSLGGVLALTALVAQLARDRGRRMQPDLFQKWGGAPSELLLSFRYSTLSHPTIVRYHERLREVLPALNIPRTQEEEDRDPTAAMAVYESCRHFLLEHTRQDPLVQEENRNFGYRRNLYAMKSFGVITSLAGVLATGGSLWHHAGTTGTVHVPAVIYGLIALLLFVVWVFWIKEGWIRTAADAYALRLLAACETLTRKPA